VVAVGFGWTVGGWRRGIGGGGWLAVGAVVSAEAGAAVVAVVAVEATVAETAQHTEESKRTEHTASSTQLKMHSKQRTTHSALHRSHST
jgi:hypothetical protein